MRKGLSRSSYRYSAHKVPRDKALTYLVDVILGDVGGLHRFYAFVLVARVGIHRSLSMATTSQWGVTDARAQPVDIANAFSPPLFQ
jgi:hypothetical protein